MAKNRQAKKSLQATDWEVLFPGEDFIIGTTTLRIEPLSLSSLAIILRKFTELSARFAEVSANLSDFQTSDSLKMLDLVKVIVEEAPDVLSEMSGLDVADVQGLPLVPALELFNKCVDVNLKSKESLIKNFQMLGSSLARLTGGIVPTETMN